MNRKTGSLIGIFVGVVIIVIGICIQGITITRSSGDVGKDIQFGADFYTEIYDVTRDVGYEVRYARNAIAEAVEAICKAVGWLVMAIGLGEIAYFLYKLCPKEDEGKGFVYERAPMPEASHPEKAALVTPAPFTGETADIPAQGNGAQKKGTPATHSRIYQGSYWVCSACKTKNLATRKSCWSCGQVFEQ